MFSFGFFTTVLFFFCYEENDVTVKMYISSCFYVGMAFVRYTDKESVDKCLMDVNVEGITLDSRQLVVSLAVSREKAADFSKKEEKEKKDNRNLYLAREGSK